MIPGLVSVIIPTYNRPDYLREAVESVLAQTYPSTEVLIIDDGSSDEGATTKSALKPYLSGNHQTPKVTYLYQKNGGLVSAVNRGLGLARGEYIQRLDDDDRLLPEKIARSVEVFQARPAVGLVATGYYHIDAMGKRLRTYPPRRCPDSERLFNMLMGCISACAGVMVRSLVHQKVGAYRDIKAQDYEMWIRIAKEFKVETINLPLAEYRQHPGSSIHFKDNRAQMERDILNFIREQIESNPFERTDPQSSVRTARLCAARCDLPTERWGIRKENTACQSGAGKGTATRAERSVCCDSGRVCWLSMRTDLFPSMKISPHRIESRRNASPDSVSNINGFRREMFPRPPRKQ